MKATRHRRAGLPPIAVPPTLTAAEAARLLAVEPRTVRLWIRQGRLAGGTVDRRVIVAGAAVAERLAEYGIAAEVERVAS